MESLNEYFEREADEGRREVARARRERYLDEAVKIREQTERIERYEKKLDEWCYKQKRLRDLIQRNTQKLRDLSNEFKLKTTED
jgi:hypothetical protein